MKTIIPFFTTLNNKILPLCVLFCLSFINLKAQQCVIPSSVTSSVGPQAADFPVTNLLRDLQTTDNPTTTTYPSSCGYDSTTLGYIAGSNSGDVLFTFNFATPRDLTSLYVWSAVFVGLSSCPAADENDHGIKDATLTFKNASDVVIGTPQTLVVPINPQGSELGAIVTFSANYLNVSKVELNVTSRHKVFTELSVRRIAFGGLPPCDSGTTAPVLSVTTLNNMCPATTANLTTITASNTPAGTTLTWHTATPATDANKITGTAVTAGTFYAAFYDATNTCYSGVGGDGSVTQSVTVAIVPCCNAGTDSPKF